MVSLAVNVLSYVTIQLYAYVATRRVFKRIDKRRSMRRARRNREFTDIENFVALLVSFLIAGSIFIAVSSLFPELAALSIPVWVIDAVLIAIGYFVAKSLGVLQNPYA